MASWPGQDNGTAKITRRVQFYATGIFLGRPRGRSGGARKRGGSEKGTFNIVPEVIDECHLFFVHLFFVHLFFVHLFFVLMSVTFSSSFLRFDECHLFFVHLFFVRFDECHLFFV
jgi:hypothetical protein